MIVEKREDGNPEYNYIPFCTKLVGMKLYGMLYDAQTGSLVDFITPAHRTPSRIDVYAVPSATNRRRRHSSIQTQPTQGGRAQIRSPIPYNLCACDVRRCQAYTHTSGMRPA